MAIRDARFIIHTDAEGVTSPPFILSDTLKLP